MPDGYNPTRELMKTPDTQNNPSPFSRANPHNINGALVSRACDLWAIKRFGRPFRSADFREDNSMIYGKRRSRAAQQKEEME